MIKQLNDDILARYFRIAYLAMVMMNFTNFTNHNLFFKFYTYALVAFGAVILVLRAVRYKDYLKTPGLLLLIAMILLYGVSSVVNYSYGGFSGLVSNGKTAVFMCCYMLLLYVFRPSSKEELRKELRLIAYIIIIFNFVSSLVSYCMLVVNYTHIAYVNDGVIIYGFVWNRLWGTYSDPNHGAVVSVVASLLSAYFLLEKPGKKLVLFHWSHIILSLLYIIYSDSRTGFVTLVIGVFLYSFLFFFYIAKNKKGIRRSPLICICLAIVIAAGVVGSLAILKPVGLLPRQAYFQVQEIISEGKPLQGDSQDDGDQPQTQPDDPESAQPSDKDPLKVGREDSQMNNDLSNRRFSIWFSGLEIVKETPIFGTSFRNLVSFAKAKTPETYLVNNDLGSFSCVHNSVLDVLVSQGIAGFAVFICFTVLVLKKAFAYLLSNKKTLLPEQLLMLSVVFAVAVSSMFISEIMYINSIGGAVFWLFLGYSMQICVITEEEHHA